MGHAWWFVSHWVSSTPSVGPTALDDGSKTNPLVTVSYMYRVTFSRNFHER